MSSEEYDATDAVEQAWAGFRARLADLIADLEEDEPLIIEMETGLDVADLSGAGPFVQFIGWGDGTVRAEVAGNAFLHERYQLEESGEHLLTELGWRAPTYGLDDEADEGSANFFIDVALREADLLAVMSVRALREVFGCLHPTFLVVDGMKAEPAVVSVSPEPHAVRGQAPAFPRDAEELHELVHEALRAGSDDPVKVDEDGDFPFRSGGSVVFVRVREDLPAVDLYAELVGDVRDLERAALEVALLNRSHGYAKFYVRDQTIVMRYRLCAFPFVRLHLHAVLSRFLEDADELARDLAARVDGLRFLDPPRPEQVPSAPPIPYVLARRNDANPVMIGLLEMLHADPVPTATVAALFDHDRLELIRQLVWVRTGWQPCGSLDQEMVLDHLRRALRLVADGHAAPEAPPRPPRRTPGRRTQQLTLLADLADEQPTLDSGWDQEVS